jgi:hypothetical protein
VVSDSPQLTPEDQEGRAEQQRTEEGREGGSESFHEAAFLVPGVTVS